MTTCHPRPTRHLGQLGFALAEAMVAIAILGLIGVLVFGTFARAMDGRDQAEAMSTYYHEVRQAMLRMSRELEMAFVSEDRNCDERRTDTNFVAKRTGNGMRLDFAAFSHYVTHADANESDQEEISYFVDSDPEHAGKSALIRRSKARLDADFGEEGSEKVLAENVNSVEFSLYDWREDRWEDEWDARGTDKKRRLPMFVKITLKVEDPTGKEEVFVTKTRIFLVDSISNGGKVACPD